MVRARVKVVVRKSFIYFFSVIVRLSTVIECTRNELRTFIASRCGPQHGARPLSVNGHYQEDSQGIAAQPSCTQHTQPVQLL